jgi:hypothetical protein
MSATTVVPYAIVLATWTAKFGASLYSYAALSLLSFVVVTTVQFALWEIIKRVLKVFWPVLLLLLGAGVGMYFEEIRQMAVWLWPLVF